MFVDNHGVGAAVRPFGQRNESSLLEDRRANVNPVFLSFISQPGRSSSIHFIRIFRESKP